MVIHTSDRESEEIRSLDLFSGLDDARFSLLMRGAYVQNFPPMIELITEGDTSDFLHVLVSGSVELFANWNGRETTMAVLQPTSTFILAATIRRARYLMSARTLEKSRIILVPSEDVGAVFDLDPDFSRAVVTELAQCYRANIMATKNLKLRSSLERLANHLLSARKLAGNLESFELGLEKRRLASNLGMTPENLSRAIRQLKPYGVAIDGSRVTIADPSDLEGLAKPTDLIDTPCALQASAPAG
ncbi:cyclic nucleotide-binding domain-containing protein [uncultured Thioclava sp.]|uniref:cyclic nucleotide-binding domain-containing protein n=1 Tax=uncultured Thioclava sp. TaxID=473858 RepID=UPI0025D6AE59|nr:cyclic nucleotide-binding domain-containing protein [uncultured Thioclava sp.]